MLNVNWSLGITISQQTISFALLRKVMREIRLVKSGSVQTPDKALVNGEIKDPAVLGKAIKNLIDRNKIRYRKASVAVITRPMLSLIVELPKDVPVNLSNYIQQEIKHSALLSGKEPRYDYCGIGKGRDEKQRLLVAATDNGKISVLIKALETAKVDPVTIETAPFAASRAIFDKKISPIGMQGLTLFAYLNDSTLTISVMKKRELDFTRNIDLTPSSQDAPPIAEQCLTEIDAVIRYYEFELNTQQEEQWRMVLVSENSEVPVSQIYDKVSGKYDFEILTSDNNNVSESCPVSAESQAKDACLSSLGSALKNLSPAGPMTNINLMPPEAEEIKEAKQLGLITANAAAVIVMVMFWISGLIYLGIEGTRKFTEDFKKDNPANNIEKLLKEQRHINSEMSYLTGKKEKMGVINSHGDVSYVADFMNEIRKNTPKALCINSVLYTNNVALEIQGNALSYKSIHLFAELLSGNERFESAKVTETGKNREYEGFVTFKIDCVLKKGNEAQTANKG